MESVVLNALRFNLTAVTPYTFVRRVASLMSLREETRHLAEYLAEITIQEFQFLQFRPSIIAFSAVKLAICTVNEEHQHSALFSQILATWGISLESINPCCRLLHATHCDIFDKTRKLQASFEKFSHSKWCVPTSRCLQKHRRRRWAPVCALAGALTCACRSRSRVSLLTPKRTCPV